MAKADHIALPDAIRRRAKQCGEGERLGPVACEPRCYAKRRDWTHGDLREVTDGLDQDYIDDLWNGKGRAMTFDYLGRLKEKLRQEQPDGDERLQRPMQEFESDRFDAAVKAEASQPSDWEVRIAQAPQVSAEAPVEFDLAHIPQLPQLPQALADQAHYGALRLVRRLGPAGEGGFEPPIG